MSRRLQILFENEAWMPPLREALDARGVPYVERHVEDGFVDLLSDPPDDVYLNRMSPSSHTRGHQGGVVFTKQLLRVLEAADRTVINGSRAFDLEVSKVEQHLALRRAGLLTPRTIAVVGGPDRLLEAARTLALPFITKDNQGGKGLGVQLFRSLDAFEAYVRSADYVPGPDGVTLLQQYIEPAEPFITRVELVAGRFLYAIRSSTVNGFELCPADACAVDEAFCPVDASPASTFALRPEITEADPLVQAYLRLMGAHGLSVAGIEFVEDAEGRRWTYDLNGTSNYNGAVEAEHGLSGMGAVAELARRLLDQPGVSRRHVA